MWLFNASDAHIRLMHPVRYVIGLFQRSIECEDVGKVLKTKEPVLFSTMTALTEVRRGEYAFSGPFHLGEWEDKRLTPKSMLREEMFKFIGFDLPDKPVVAFFKDEYCYEPELAKGLRDLSNHATITCSYS
jgi:hypothetical protein